MKEEQLNREEASESHDKKPEELTSKEENNALGDDAKKYDNEEIEELNRNLKQSSDKYLRLVAEFDNFRKRTAKERNDLIKNGGQDIIKPLLDVLDDADRAEEQLAKASDVASLKEGMELIFNKLRNILAAKGLKKMDSLGELFNPELHDAITEIPAPTEEDSGKILDVIQTGYYLNDKIIRHAKVVVGK